MSFPPGPPDLTRTRRVRGCRACLPPRPCLPPSPRQPIRRLSRALWLLGDSLPCAPCGCPLLKAENHPRLRRSGSPVGPRGRPPLCAGCLGSVSGAAPDPPRPQPGLLAPTPHPRRRAPVLTMQTEIRLPVPLQLCPTGFPVGFRVAAFYPRCGACGAVAPPEATLSTLHRGAGITPARKASYQSSS
jgi:hypothetical protein